MNKWRTWWIAGDKAISDGHIVPDKYLGGVQVIEVEALMDIAKALRSLRNEVKGTLYAHEMAIRYDHGNSNWQCLELTLSKSEEALTKAQEILERVR